MTLLIDPTWQMWIVIGALVAAIVSFSLDRFSVEVTSLALLGFLLLWFNFFPLTGADGENLLGAAELLNGFSNPSLIAVLALIVMGQAMVQTGALTELTRMFVRLSKHHRRLSIGSIFAGVLLISAFLNNTPVVVMFIPIMQAVAYRLRMSPSHLMMPLSFAAILGGMTTLIGSSTNLLVSSALIDLGEDPLQMFDFTVIGVCMAAVGAAYVILLLPRFLPHRGDMTDTLRLDGKQFIAEIDVTAGSALVGQCATAGQFKALPDITVRLIQRGDQIILPPFDGVELREGDLLLVAATRQALVDALARHAGYMLSRDSRDPAEPGDTSTKRPAERVLAEVMIAPASRMIDQTVDMVGFQRRFGCIVMGIQRRGRMARQRMTDVRLEAGDVLLIVGARKSVDGLANNSDLVLMAWAIRDVPKLQRAHYAAAIFAATVAAASTGFMPITIAALVGAFAMIATDCLNIRQAVRAVDRQILLLVGSTLALSTALEVTGAATYIATVVLSFAGPHPLVNMTILFLLVSALTNVLSNNACAILFTPIAVSLAYNVGVPASAMAITVLLAANCSFATPIGYQTNLLVMGPGHYRFSDFMRGGLPLLVLMWLTFVLIAPSYFGFGW
ncbi:MAG TPA: SLC13 family permease [Alphaproteobacteria bacterium]|nr:SLC13 family permease [Alphaproteobacteria bacterium]